MRFLIAIILCFPFFVLSQDLSINDMEHIVSSGNYDYYLKNRGYIFHRKENVSNEFYLYTYRSHYDSRHLNIVTISSHPKENLIVVTYLTDSQMMYDEIIDDLVHDKLYKIKDGDTENQMFFIKDLGNYLFIIELNSELYTSQSYKMYYSYK